MQFSTNSIKVVQLFEKRIDASMEAASRCEEGTWAHTFWTKNHVILLRKLNNYLGNHKSALSSAGLEQQPSKL